MPVLRQALYVRRIAKIPITLKIQINWKHILFHFLAFWFFSHAFMMFAWFNNLEVAETVRHSINDIEVLTAISLSKMAVSLSIGFFIGYVVALIIAILVSVKIKGSWINTILAFIIFFALMHLDLLGWNYLKIVFLYPGSFFDGWMYYGINASILLIIGIFFLFRILKVKNLIKKDNSLNPPQYA